MLRHCLPILFLSLLCITFINAQNVTTPRPSPQAELKQKLGLTKVTVNYSRPQVVVNGNDRTGKIWGGLVAYGFQKINFASQGEIPWRAGANENTVISFSDDVKVEGKALKAGKYGLHMAIHEDGKATVIFSKNTSSWGSFWYNPEEDALRVDVQTQEAPFTNILTFDFVDVGKDYGVLALTWEKKRIPFKIEVDVKEAVLASFRDEMRGVIGFGWQAPMSAANYCAQNNFNHEEALKWADLAVNRNKTVQTLTVKATLLNQMGKTPEAIAITDEAAQMANIGQLNNLGYAMLQNKQVDKAIEYFKLNVERNPDNANCHDSLGEALVAKGDKENAVKSFKKSLSLNPPPNVKANSLKYLKQLGVDYKEKG